LSPSSSSTLSLAAAAATAAAAAFLSIPAMSQYAESSGGGRARSRHQGGWSKRIGFDPVGDLSGFPLVCCPDCGEARGVEAGPGRRVLIMVAFTSSALGMG
jgi:hypothetical protein